VETSLRVNPTAVSLKLEILTTVYAPPLLRYFNGVFHRYYLENLSFAEPFPKLFFCHPNVKGLFPFFPDAHFDFLSVFGCVEETKGRVFVI